MSLQINCKCHKTLADKLDDKYMPPVMHITIMSLCLSYVKLVVTTDVRFDSVDEIHKHISGYSTPHDRKIRITSFVTT